MNKYVASIMGAVFGLAFTAFALPEDEKVIPEVAIDDGQIDLPGDCSFPQNLVTNCGFETGNLSGWTTFGETTFIGVGTGIYAHSGNFGLFAGPVATTGGVYQNIPTTAGQLYAVTFFLRNSAQGAVTTFSVSWNGTVIYSCSNCGDFPYTVYGINHQMATGAMSELRFTFLNPPDYFGLDDVIVVPCDQ